MKKVSFVPWENTGMEILKKPPLKKPHVYIKFSVCAVFALAYCVLMFFAFYNAERYTSAVPLELEAKIVRVECVSTEDSDSYDAIMRYVHEGVAYEAAQLRKLRNLHRERWVEDDVLAVILLDDAWANILSTHIGCCIYMGKKTDYRSALLARSCRDSTHSIAILVDAYILQAECLHLLNQEV